MKKLFLFIGVIMLCIIFSCKKDSPPPPPPQPVDSFLLHPPPVLDSLPIPLTIGTWWKYQRIDSSTSYFNQCYCVPPVSIDSCIELITVIGKTTIVDTVQENRIFFRNRFDTIESFMLEVKNLTNATLDTIHAFYYNAQFFIKPNKDIFRLIMHLPIAEGTQIVKTPMPYPNYLDSINVIKNSSVNVLNQKFDNCIYYSEFYSLYTGANSYGNHLTTYLKPGIGFVYWEYFNGSGNHYGFEDDSWYYRRLIDYHIAP
jgi:hypothetical protein